VFDLNSSIILTEFAKGIGTACGEWSHKSHPAWKLAGQLLQQSWFLPSPETSGSHSAPKSSHQT